MMEKLSNAVLDDLDRLLEKAATPTLAPDEFTVKTVAKRRGIGYNIAARLIEKMEREGTVVFVGLRDTGRCPAKAWKVVKKKK